MKPECLNKSNEEKKECSGGQRCCIYEIIDTVPYFDKGGHKESSLANQPNHRKHWKKVEKLEK